MKTVIKDIKTQLDTKTGKEYKILYFDYNDLKDRFTYLTQKSVEYWQSKGVKTISIGDTINVLRVPNTKYYQIIHFERLKS